MYIFGREFFAQFFEVVDLIVVYISLIFEIVLLIVQDNLVNVFLLIIGLRLWRVIRIVHGK